MEYVPGTTLERLIGERAPMPLRSLVDLGAQISAGLAAAHAAGVVHRDLKPANVLVGEQGRVVITDFGIARTLNQDSGTQLHEVVGTPQYMAPEQVLGRVADARSDLYAIGVILYEMATGVLPFEGDSAVSVALARVQACPVDPRERYPVDERLVSLVMRCLTREPEGRLGAAAELQQALRALVGEAAPVAEPTPVPIVEVPARPYAPISAGDQTVAVLPFAFRGPSEHAYLGEAMAEELVDVLARTQGLRVLSMRATRRFAEERDPSAIGAALGASTIVDGTVQHMGGRIRLSVRMIDPDGAQRWSERYDGSLEDVFALQESLGRRVAEALRIELTAAAHRCTAPREAIEHYLRARRLVHKLTRAACEEAIAMLDRALERAPEFGPALAAHAIASVRTWWGFDGPSEDRANADKARCSVLRARKRAPGLAETHLAIAMWEVQSGGYVAAARALSTALEIAPTMVEAHQYLGQLQCEAGRPEEGQRHLALALELDPSLRWCRYPLARTAELMGDSATSKVHIEALRQSMPGLHVATLVLSFRLALYRGERDEARRLRERLVDAEAGADAPIHRMTGIVFGETSPEQVDALLERHYRSRTNGRFTTLMRQVATELFTLVGDRSRALRELTAAADTVLIDAVWLQRCSMLEPLRGEPAFVRAEQAVHRRVAPIWQ